uniref:CD96 molecule n=1 Tax=Pelodiscus sinensis TaxID=13735 RepID=K7GG73_PELSI
MEKRWPSCVFCLFILTHHVDGQLEGTIIKTEAVHALPGSDVTLMCSILNGNSISVTQTQWSKVDDTPPSRIAVSHPVYGITKTHHCWADFNQTSISHDARANPVECYQWILHLSNVSLSLTGRYECSFATYPYGTQVAEINLIINSHIVSFSEDEKHYVVAEVLLNQTLEIPCFENITSVNWSKYPLKWLIAENGHEETTLTIKEFYHQDVSKTINLLYKERIQLGANNELKISPVKINDDNKVFSCYVKYHPERILASTTKVKVFAKPEISIALQNRSNGTVGEASLTCIVRKAFPKPNLTWYADGEILNDQLEETSVEAENLKDGEGLYELRSILKIQSTNQSSTNQTFWCMCSFPFLGNKTWNISSEEIIVSSGKLSSLSPSLVFTRIIQNLQSSKLPSVSSTSLTFTSPVTSKPVSTAQSKYYSGSFLCLRYFLYCCTDLRKMGMKKSVQQTTLITFSSSEPHHGHGVERNGQFDSTTDIVRYTNATASSESETSQPHINGSTKVKPENVHFSWPAVVAILLLLCSFLILLGIRKWCLYQKEIMNRPPSFKPPPPPIKYASMIESDGTTQSCHELETL